MGQKIDGKAVAAKIKEDIKGYVSKRDLDGKRKPLEKGERISGIYPYYGASGIIDYVKD